MPCDQHYSLNTNSLYMGLNRSNSFSKNWEKSIHRNTNNQLFYYDVRSLHCIRISIHTHMFVSIALNNLAWILWYEKKFTHLFFKKKIFLLQVSKFIFIDFWKALAIRVNDFSMLFTRIFYLDTCMYWFFSTLRYGPVMPSGAEVSVFSPPTSWYHLLLDAGWEH